MSRGEPQVLQTGLTGHCQLIRHFNTPFFKPAFSAAAAAAAMDPECISSFKALWPSSISKALLSGGEEGMLSLARIDREGQLKWITRIGE